MSLWKLPQILSQSKEGCKNNYIHSFMYSLLLEKVIKAEYSDNIHTPVYRLIKILKN